MAAILRDGRFRDIDGQDLGALRRQPQREAARVAEAVEQSSRGVSARGVSILALIQEQTCFLPAPWINFELDGANAHADRLRHVTVDHLDAWLQPFQQADARVVAREDADRGHELDEDLTDGWEEAVDPL